MTNLDPDLKALVERIENVQQRLDDDKQDMSDLYAEAKSKGYNDKAVKAVLKERAMDEPKRKKAKQLEEDIELYKLRLGMLSDLPLGQAAIDRAAAG